MAAGEPLAPVVRHLFRKFKELLLLGHVIYLDKLLQIWGVAFLRGLVGLA